MEVVPVGTCSCWQKSLERHWDVGSFLASHTGVKDPHHLLKATSDGHKEDLVEPNCSVSRVPVHSERCHGGISHPQILHTSQWPWTVEQCHSQHSTNFRSSGSSNQIICSRWWRFELGLTCFPIFRHGLSVSFSINWHQRDSVECVGLQASQDGGAGSCRHFFLNRKMYKPAAFKQHRRHKWEGCCASSAEEAMTHLAHKAEVQYQDILDFRWLIKNVTNVADGRISILPVLPWSLLLRRWEHKSLCTPSPGPLQAPSVRSGWSWLDSKPAGSWLRPEALKNID